MYEILNNMIVQVQVIRDFERKILCRRQDSNPLLKKFLPLSSNQERYIDFGKIWS